MCVHSGIRERHISSCCVWELLSVASAQAERYRQEMNRLPLSAFVIHKALPVSGRAPQRFHTLGTDLDWQRENAQAIKPPAHVQTQISLHGITRKRRSRKIQDVGTDECARRGPWIKGNANMND